MNKAIIVVSYGTSCIDAIEKNIKPIEREVAEKYGDEYKVMSAFTSYKIISRLKKEYNMDILTPEKALEQLLEGGYEDVTIQPLHIIPGKEFDYIKKVGKDFSDKFKGLRLGRPLLYFFSKEACKDYDDLIEALLINLPKDENVILVGHGTSHPGNSCYECLQKRLKDLGHENIHIALIGAYPSIEDTIKYLRFKGIKKVALAPFLLVLGVHARNDIFSEKGGSWALRLKSEGISVLEIYIGLGEYKEIRNIYMNHLRDALNGRNLVLDKN